MLRRRIALPLVAVIAVTLLATLAQQHSLRTRVEGLFRHTIGPFYFDAYYLSSPRPVRIDGMPDVWGTTLAWNSERAESLFGNVRVLAFWVDSGDKTWLFPRLTCPALQQRFEPIDHLIASPRLPSVSVDIRQFCTMYSWSERRTYLYGLSVTPPRCGRRAVLFARVPWLYAVPEQEQLSPQQQAFNQRMETYNAVVTQPIASSGFNLDSRCIAQIGRTSATVWWTDSLLLIGLSLLAWKIWRQSRAVRELRSGVAARSSAVPHLHAITPVLLELGDDRFSERLFHIAKSGEYLGTFQPEEVLRQVALGGLSRADLCWRVGMPLWQPIEVALQLPPPLPPPAPLLPN